MAGERLHGVYGFGFVLAALGTMACGEGPSPFDEGVDAENAPLTFGACANNCSSWVYPSAITGKLIYVPDHEADRIPDFARVGYGKSRKGLLSDSMPSLGTRIDYTGPAPRGTDFGVCGPNFQDHGAAINAALASIGTRPENSSGVRGHLYLPRGYYAVFAPIVVPDGVVLVGESPEPSGSSPPTVLRACTGMNRLVTVSSPTGNEGVIGATYPIEDDVVPVGATSVTVSPPPGAIARGARVDIVRRSSTQWVAELGLSDIWTGENFIEDFHFERTVQHVEPVTASAQYRIFFEHPLTNALEDRWAPIGATHLLRVYSSVPERAQFSGVYRIRGKSATNLAEHFLVFEYAIDSWAKDLVAEGFQSSAVTTGGASRQITVQNVSSRAPSGPISGGFRYSFQARGHMNLFANCTADDGRHDVLVQKSESSGPHVFLECQTTNSNADSGSHHDWSRGTLFDNVTVQKKSGVGGRAGKFTAANLAPWDPGNTDSHGWSGANLVFWNSTAVGYDVFNPPTAQNWLIGSIGTLGAPNGSIGESNPHFDFEDAAEHGARAVLTGTSSSLFRTANAEWRSFLDENQEVEVRHYLIGDPDQPLAGEIGQGEDNNDEPPLNGSFGNWVASRFGAPNGNFDAAVAGNTVPFTARYQLEPDEQIVHAYLTVRVEREGAYSSDANHHVTLATSSFETQNVTFHFRCTGVPAPCTEIPPNMTGPSGFGPLPTYPVVRVIDLGNYLGWLNKTTELNVSFYKRTRVDWAALTLLVKRP